MLKGLLIVGSGLEVKIKMVMGDFHVATTSQLGRIVFLTNSTNSLQWDFLFCITAIIRHVSIQIIFMLEIFKIMLTINQKENGFMEKRILIIVTEKCVSLKKNS